MMVLLLALSVPALAQNGQGNQGGRYWGCSESYSGVQAFPCF
jgi:hypothetical protein